MFGYGYVKTENPAISKINVCRLKRITSTGKKTKHL